MAFDLENAGFMTRAIHAGQEPDPAFGALATPIRAFRLSFQRLIRRLKTKKGGSTARMEPPQQGE